MLFSITNLQVYDFQNNATQCHVVGGSSRFVGSGINLVMMTFVSLLWQHGDLAIYYELMENESTATRGIVEMDFSVSR